MKIKSGRLIKTRAGLPIWEFSLPETMKEAD